MKSLLFIAIVLTNICYAQQLNDWENPALVQQNKENPHASWMIFDTATDVKTDDYNLSPYYQSLNGVWKFTYTGQYADRLVDFYQ
jgi:beta-galactosidase